jgi:hypothetical protein
VWGSISLNYVLQYYDVGIHRSARKHGVDDAAILHALDHAITVIDLDPESDLPKVLAIGPDSAGNLLEIIWLELVDDVNLVFTPCRCDPLSTTCSHNPGRTRHDRP